MSNANSFHEILNTISSKADEMDSAEVRQTLAKLGSLHDDLVAKVQVFGADAKEKRQSSEVLKKELRELKATNETLGNQISSFDESALKKEYDMLKGREEQLTNNVRDNLLKELSSYQNHSNWDKVKTELAISQSEEGKIDLSKLNANDIDILTKDLSRVKNLGVLDTNTAPDNPLAKTFGSPKQAITPNGELSPEDMQDGDKVKAWVSSELQKAM